MSTKKAPQQTLTEADIQKQVVQYIQFKYPNALIHHSPNEGKRTNQTGMLLRSMGMHKGFPDLAILEPRGKYHGLFLELKRDKHSRPTQEQNAWIKALQNRGYAAAVTYGFEDTIKALNEYMERKDNG